MSRGKNEANPNVLKLLILWKLYPRGNLVVVRLIAIAACGIATAATARKSSLLIAFCKFAPRIHATPSIS